MAGSAKDLLCRAHTVLAAPGQVDRMLSLCAHGRDDLAILVKVLNGTGELDLTSSAALKGRDSSRDLGSRCWFAVHGPGNPEASPGSHGMPCRGFVLDRACACLAVADMFDCITVRREGAALPSRPEGRGLHAAILMIPNGRGACPGAATAWMPG